MTTTPDTHDPARTPTILDVIAANIRRGGDDADGWIRVLRAYQWGVRAYPEPWQPRHPPRCPSCAHPVATHGALQPLPAYCCAVCRRYADHRRGKP
jgi:hypothetical protein